MNYYVKYDNYCQDYRIYDASTHRKLSLKASFAVIKKFYSLLENNRVNEIRCTDYDLIWSFYTFLFHLVLPHDNSNLLGYVSVTHISFKFTPVDTVVVQAFFSSSSMSFSSLSPDIPF